MNLIALPDVMAISDWKPANFLSIIETATSDPNRSVLVSNIDSLAYKLVSFCM
jgi:hypothetical protein